jgi:hypothetical protein
MSLLTMEDLKDVKVCSYCGYMNFMDPNEEVKLGSVCTKCTKLREKFFVEDSKAIMRLATEKDLEYINELTSHID